MGTTDRPGSERESTPPGPSFLDSTPGPGPEGQPSVFPAPGDEAALAAWLASDPFAGQDRPWSADEEWERHNGLGTVDLGALEAWPGDEDMAALIAHDPFAPDHRAADPRSAMAGVFPAPMKDPPLADPGQFDPVLSRLPGRADLGRVRMLRASVPDLPEAPRPDNPPNLHWSPVAAADALAHLDPGNLGENDLLDYIHTANRLAAFAHATQNTALAVFAHRRPPLASETPNTGAGAGTRAETGAGTEASTGAGTEAGALAGAGYRSRYAAAEIMALFCVGTGTANTLLDDAETLANNLPGTTTLYREGLLDTIRIKAILRGLENVPAPVQTTIEAPFLPGAARTTTPTGRTYIHTQNTDPCPF